jgi:hypothetical protein
MISRMGQARVVAAIPESQGIFASGLEGRKIEEAPPEVEELSRFLEGL